MSELLPCPFCGGEAEIQHQVHKVGTDFLDWFGVYCKNPFCGHVCGHDTEAEAIAAWNTRAQTVFGMTLDEVRQMMKRDAERERTCLNADDDETDAWFMCSECECHVLIEYMSGGFGVPRYCPNCGAKVVEQ